MRADYDSPAGHSADVGQVSIHVDEPLDLDLLRSWLGELLWEEAAGAGADIRRFFFLRGRREIIEDLRARQHALAVRLRALHDEWVHTGTA